MGKRQFSADIPGELLKEKIVSERDESERRHFLL